MTAGFLFNRRLSINHITMYDWRVEIFLYSRPNMNTSVDITKPNYVRFQQAFEKFGFIYSGREGSHKSFDVYSNGKYSMTLCVPCMGLTITVGGKRTAQLRGVFSAMDGEQMFHFLNKNLLFDETGLLIKKTTS